MCVHAEILVDEGDAATILLGLARFKNADLLVMVRTDRGGGHGGLADNADAVDRHALCAVASV